MKLTFLGTGTSQGVPVIGCRCKVCTSADRRDNRLRTSAMVETRGVRIVIDARADFRYQMLRTGVRHLDAILLTHEHKDHIGGLDDVPGFQFRRLPADRPQGPYLGRPAGAGVRAQGFRLCLRAGQYRGVPEIELHEIDTARPVPCRRCGDRARVGPPFRTLRGHGLPHRAAGLPDGLQDHRGRRGRKTARYGGAGGQCAAFLPRIRRISTSRRRWR